MGRKEGAAVPLSRRAGTPSNTMWPRSRSTYVPSGVFIHPAVWPQSDMGQKLGGVGVSLFVGVAGSPSKTKSPGPKPTSIASGTLVHPAVWQQQTWAKNWVAVVCPFFWG